MNNIIELIKELRHFASTWVQPAADKAADALLAQQVVIEQMREALIELNEYIPVGASIAAIKLQPDLSALREHDAEVIRKVSGKIYDPLINKILFDESERIRKGE